MRRFMLLVALLLSLAAPTTVVAGGCPTDPGGLVDKEAYRVGGLIQFFDSYTDFTQYVAFLVAGAVVMYADTPRTSSEAH